MTRPPIVYYKIDYDEASKIYTGYCPSMKPVRFSDTDESKVKEQVEDGINVFLNKNPDFFDNFKELKR